MTKINRFTVAKLKAHADFFSPLIIGDVVVHTLPDFGQVERYIVSGRTYDYPPEKLIVSAPQAVAYANSLLEGSN